MSEPTPTIGWRKREEDSLIVVWNLPDGPESVPMLDASQWNQIQMVEYKWGDLCREVGGQHHLPDGWLQAMIWRESGGDEHARNREGTPTDPSDDGIGLLQITNRALKGGRTDVELFVPRTNIGIGAGYISYLASRPDTRGKDGVPDFARLAAAFNHGHVEASTANRWGMVSTGSHIDQEVRAYNTWVYLKLEGEKFYAAQAFAKSFPTKDLLGDDADAPAGLKDDEAPPTPRNT